MFCHVLPCFDQLRSTSWLRSLKASSKFSQIFHGTPLIKCWSSSGQHCFRLVATSCSCHRHLHIQPNNQMHSVCGHTRKHPSTWNYEIKWSGKLRTTLLRCHQLWIVATLHCNELFLGCPKAAANMSHIFTTGISIGVKEKLYQVWLK